jgi:hypothetical protein
MTVTSLPTSDLSDLPKMLRQLADDLGNGKYGKVCGAVVVLEATGLPVFGFGSADPVNTSELLACAHQKLVMYRLGAVI